MTEWNKLPFFFVVRVFQATVSIYSLCLLTLLRSKSLPLKESSASAHVGTVRDEHDFSFGRGTSRGIASQIVFFRSSDLFVSLSVHFHGVLSLMRFVNIAEDSVKFLTCHL